MVNTPNGYQWVYQKEDSDAYFEGDGNNKLQFQANGKRGTVYRNNPIESSPKLTPTEFLQLVTQGYTPDDLISYQEQEPDIAGYNVLPELTVVAKNKKSGSPNDTTWKQTLATGILNRGFGNDTVDYTHPKPYDGSKSNSQNEAMLEARNLGYQTFIYNGREYPVDYAPKDENGNYIDPYTLNTKDYANAQMKQYGITSNFARNKSKFMEDFVKHIPNEGYDYKVFENFINSTRNNSPYLRYDPVTGQGYAMTPEPWIDYYGNPKQTSPGKLRLDMKALSVGYPTKYGTVVISEDDMTRGKPDYGYTFAPSLGYRYDGRTGIGEQSYDKDDKKEFGDPFSLKEGERAQGTNYHFGNVGLSGLKDGYSVYDTFDYSAGGKYLNIDASDLIQGPAPEIYYRVHKKKP